MPFHPSNTFSMKYSSIEYQKLHEYEYKKYLKNLPINLSEQKLLKHREIYFNNNYLFQRQINLQYRQDKRKHEYERIQKENFKFSQRLINAKPFLNRYEQQIFFDKHSKLKQRLQHYPNLIQNQTNNHFKIINKPVDSAFLIYNDNAISHQSIKLQDKHSKDSLSSINKPQKKLLPRFIKHNSQISKTLPPITSIIQNTGYVAIPTLLSPRDRNMQYNSPVVFSKPHVTSSSLSTKTSEVSNTEPDSSKNESSLIPSINIINWNKSTNTENLKPSSSPLKILSSQSSSTSESNLSDFC